MYYFTYICVETDEKGVIHKSKFFFLKILENRYGINTKENLNYFIQNTQRQNEKKILFGVYVVGR